MIYGLANAAELNANMESPLIEEHRAAGAQVAQIEGCTLPARFSTIETEFAAGREKAALFDTSWQATWSVGGRDRVQYLHNITSNDIKSLAEGRGTLALLLNPQGHILAELEIYALVETLLARSHISLRERTLATLKKYIIGSKVTIEDLSDSTGSIAVEGPCAAHVVRQACGLDVEAFADLAIQDVQVEGAACRLVRRSHFGQTGAEWIAPWAALPAIWNKLLREIRAVGGQPIGMEALNALRLEAGVPWFPADFNEAMIPHEAAVENTHVSFNKGCYTGQEIVERVRSRGHVNRKRVSLTFSTRTAPSIGTKLRAGGAEVGAVTSAAFSPAADTSIGMGYVRREQFAPGSVVEFDGGTAAVR